MLSFFQNCSRVVSTGSSSHASKGGGTGTDGKTYVSYGQCPDGSVGVASIVKVSKDDVVSLVRQDCETLSTPQPLQPSDLKFSASDSSVMTLKGKVFDEQTNQPKTTIEYCQSSNTATPVEVLVWRPSDSNSLFGRIDQTGGSSSGTLRVAAPIQPLNFVTVAGQSSRFDLMLTNPSSGSLTYALDGAAQVSVPTVSCLFQSLPDPFPNASNTGVPSGITLTNATSTTVSVDGTVIDSKLVTGCIEVRANNVTIKNSRILGGNCALPIHITSPYSGLVIEDSEIDGQNSPTCDRAIGDGGYTIRRVFVHGCDQGLALLGSANILIQDSYIRNKSHGAKAYGLKLAVGNSVKIIHNTIETSNGPAIFTADNSTGDLIVDSNLLVAGNYPLTLYDNQAWVQNNLIYDNSAGDISSFYGPVSTFFGDRSDPGLTIREWANNHLTSRRDGSVVGAILSQPTP